MAVVNKNAAAVTNADAAPTQALNSTRLSGGRVKESVGQIAVTNGDSIASILRLARVHSSWRVSQLLLFCTAITTGAADFGLYEIAKAGGAVVDVDFFATAASIATVQNGVDITHEAGGTGSHAGDISKIELPLWQVLGLTADPGKYYDIAATLTGAATADGVLAVLVRYIDGN